ncbi:hypothetical protein [Caulobacter hibisci]|uniref:SH3 domain-containing protein n=1 Tax=Caulobacter hibisci TaxID=2035993 RepID=A0ABS0T7L1_9CAUL|nr:hypothetical protein [Caulobacter hibisci]MBI1686863.1 hypothetical protein [Caulobacter hibisci]
MLSPPRLALFLSLALCIGLPSTAPAKPMPARRVAACAAAKVLVEGVLSPSGSRPGAVRTAPGEDILSRFRGPDGALLLDDDPNDSRWFQVKADGLPEPVRPPARATVRTFGAARQASVTDCADVRRSITARGMRIVASEGSPRMRRDGLYDVTTHTLTVPVVSPDGSEALAYADSVSGPLAGGGYLVLLRRKPDGAWKIAGRMGLWIS